MYCQGLLVVVCVLLGLLVLVCVLLGFVGSCLCSIRFVGSCLCFVRFVGSCWLFCLALLVAVCVICFFITVLLVVLQTVIVTFPCHNHLPSVSGSSLIQHFFY